MTEYQDSIAVEFTSRASVYENCICDGCHHTGYVLKLKIPTTLYHDGKNLTTKYREYWLCRACRDKLVQALIWEDADETH